MISKKQGDVMNKQLHQGVFQYMDKLQKAMQQTRGKQKNKDEIFVYSHIITELYESLLEVKHNNKKVVFIGNGGSAGIAVHFAADYQNAGRMKTQTFYDPALIT
ncbi:MAG: hypothetical protein R3Y67_08730, partial [Eubacteriales bacterium]